MAGTGGSRPGSGRHLGGCSAKSKETRELLDNNRVLILQNAIRLATAKVPNIPVLLKLLDKILPTLTSAEFDGLIQSEPFGNLDPKVLESLVTQFAAYAHAQDKAE